MKDFVGQWVKLLWFVGVSVNGLAENLRIAINKGFPVKDVSSAPFTVALISSEGALLAGLGKHSPFCTGSIIDLNWVLTAAHCIITPDSPKLITVVAGVADVNAFVVGQQRVAKSAFQHPSYVAKTPSKYDVALIQVDSFVLKPGLVETIALWAEDWTRNHGSQQFVERACQIYGWGNLEKGIQSTQLRMAGVNVRHGTKGCPCFQMFQQRRLMCSEPKHLGGLCFGDSGGPLVCNRTLVGVAHVIYHQKSCSLIFIGRPEVKCNDRQFVSTWMYVCPMLNFIAGHVRSAPRMPASCKAVEAHQLPPVAATLESSNLKTAEELRTRLISKIDDLSSPKSVDSPTDLLHTVVEEVKAQLRAELELADDYRKMEAMAGRFHETTKSCAPDLGDQLSESVAQYCSYARNASSVWSELPNITSALLDEIQRAAPNNGDTLAKIHQKLVNRYNALTKTVRAEKATPAELETVGWTMPRPPR